LEPIEVETAWRLLIEQDRLSTLSPVSTIHVFIGNEGDGHKFVLSSYPSIQGGGRQRKHMKFMNPNGALEIHHSNRFLARVTEWGRRQLKLEAQMLRAILVIKAIVNSCNTVGQYDRVSPELVGFLPDKYKLALKQMTKKSPYPAIDVSHEQIDTAMTTLAFASLQPQHADELNNLQRPSSYYGVRYSLSQFPMTSAYSSNELRSCGI
jgi:hypothetical protein